ncbi:DUF5955 family protein [Streptacidiphilus sp. P02-A3a]|uniref:DUF5955 family protein n=1 Tax=Streptacidiphilus sp. P02-A3a TaxID=2704468 RepID=UPI0015FA6583|nr:DUF5955 family protein [Streptacidiphilus sp. P02-A3a]QMU70158.1 hypothetical protein GXP74_19910 [Streptacidiphilus sp. P02-A3a]QMU70392.1 hypothetical protein GXP74_21445 [Streptacidiphilus sp. P02-A3a]
MTDSQLPGGEGDDAENEPDAGANRARRRGRRGGGDITIGGNSTLTGVAIASGDSSRASAHAAGAAAEPARPATRAELHRFLTDLLAQLRSTEEELADRPAAVEVTEELVAETSGTHPDRYRLRGMLAALQAAVGGATSLTGAVTVLVEAVKRLFGIA